MRESLPIVKLSICESHRPKTLDIGRRLKSVQWLVSLLNPEPALTLSNPGALTLNELAIDMVQVSGVRIGGLRLRLVGIELAGDNGSDDLVWIAVLEKWVILRLGGFKSKVFSICGLNAGRG